MISEREQPFNISKPNWEWTKVSCQLMTKIQGKNASVSLAPTITFEGFFDSDSGSKLETNISLDIEKSLQFDQSTGWFWHKSSNLPVISVKVELQSAEDQTKVCCCPPDLQVRIFAVKILMNPMERIKISHLQDVGLRGQDRSEINGGVALLDGIRFKTTSYINQGVNFHLLIIVYKKDEQPNCQFRNILTSVISPAIFVDSRKSARDHLEKKYASFVHIFEPSLMQRQFMKKFAKEKNSLSQIRVENSLEGLYNYLTAPNIRHKVKHPLFLCVKFSNVFKIMFNTAHSWFKQGAPDLQKIIYSLQQILTVQVGKSKKKLQSSQKSKKPFIIAITGSCLTAKKAKIFQCLQFLNCNLIETTKYNNQIGPNYVSILQSGNIVKVYKEIYHELRRRVNKDQKGKGQYENDQEEQVQEQEQQEEYEEIQGNANQKKSAGNKINLINSSEEQELAKEQNFVPSQKQQYDTRKNSQNSPNIFNSLPAVDYNFMRNYNAYNNITGDIDNAILNHPYQLPSIVQQIDIQNQILQNIIAENMMVRQKLSMSYINNYPNMPNSSPFNYHNMIPHQQQNPQFQPRFQPQIQSLYSDHQQQRALFSPQSYENVHQFSQFPQPLPQPLAHPKQQQQSLIHFEKSAFLQLRNQHFK